MSIIDSLLRIEGAQTQEVAWLLFPPHTELCSFVYNPVSLLAIQKKHKSSVLISKRESSVCADLRFKRFHGNGLRGLEN